MLKDIFIEMTFYILEGVESSIFIKTDISHGEVLEVRRSHHAGVVSRAKLGQSDQGDHNVTLAEYIYVTCLPLLQQRVLNLLIVSFFFLIVSL